MLLCRVIKPSTVSFSAQSLNSVQVRANRLRLGCINLTCSLRNSTTITLPLCTSRVCRAYAYNNVTPRVSHPQTSGGQDNTNIFRDFSKVEIGQPSHPERAYISDVAQGSHSNISSPLSYPLYGNATIFRLTELESFLFSSRAKVRAIWLPTTIVPMRTATSTAAQPKRDTGVEEHTAANSKQKPESSTPPPSQASQGPDPEPQPEEGGGKTSKTQQLKKVFKEYGAVAVSFHVAISLMSLGIFYLAVSSGLDMAVVLYKVGFSESVVQSKLAAGTSTFVLAYAVHKLFAPVRISITLVSVPLIVRYFRKTGLFKPPTPSP